MMPTFVESRGLRGFLAFLAIAGAVLCSSRATQAQTVFCPSAVPAPAVIAAITGSNSVSGIAPAAGKCTNPSIAGAFSGAALASQALGDLAGSSASMETSTAIEAISQRPTRQAEACRQGETPVDGICRPIAPRITAVPVTTVPKVVVPSAKTKDRAPSRQGLSVSRRAKSPPPPPAIRQAPVPPQLASIPLVPVPPIVDESFRIGSWAEGFGDYERRTGSQNSSFNCCTINQPNGPITPVALSVTSTMSSGGFVGGIDATKRGLAGTQDGVMFGLLGGYTWTSISVKTATTSGADVTASGSSITNANVNGPSVGFYVTYFNGPFSNAFLLKNDFLSLNESNSQTLGFGGCECFTGFKAPIPFTAASTGSGSTSLDQLTITDDVSYKIPLADHVWIAPTGGLKFVDSLYAASAAALGLADGDVFRLQGGASLGMDAFGGETRVTTVITGLVFDDVVVTGNNIQGGSFSTNGNILNDQGRPQGEGIAAVNLDLGHGMSASVQGDLYGGQGIFGAGGKASLRMQW